jgi:hypothetical protein
MIQPEPINDPYLRGLNLLPPHEINVPFMVGNSNGQRDGEVELLIREQERPPIDDLDEATRYRLGIAMRFIAYSFEVILGLTGDEALELYGAFVLAVMSRMEEYRGGLRTSFGVNDFIDVLLELSDDKYNASGVDIRLAIEWYVETVLNRTSQIGGPPRPLDLEQACNELLGIVPAFHVPSDVYDQCERAEWPPIRAEGRFFPNGAFLIIVDGETWLQFESDPTKQAQTRWMLVDARQRKLLIYESVDFRGMDVPTGANILMGATCDTPTGVHRPIASHAAFLPTEIGGWQPFSMDMAEARRMNHALFSFLTLLKSPRVTVTPHRAHGHWTMDIPVDTAVNELIDEVLDSGESVSRIADHPDERRSEP